MKIRSLGLFLPILINFGVLVGLFNAQVSLAFEVNYFLSNVILLILLLSLCIKLSNTSSIFNFVFVPGMLLTAFLISLYLSLIITKSSSFLEGISLYAINNSAVVAQYSSFLSRISTYMIPEAAFLVLYSFTLHYIIVSFRTNNLFISRLHGRMLRLLFVVLLLFRLLSSSLNSLMSLLIISLFIFSISHPNVTIITLLKRSLGNISRVMTRGSLNKKLLFLVILLTFLFLSILFLSFNRSGSLFYFFLLPFNYLDSVFSYSSSIFDFFQNATPSNCGLQSNFIFYLFSLKPISICLADFRYAISAFVDVQKGSWIGLLGAHSIDYGSSYAILSIATTAIIYALPLVNSMMLTKFPITRLSSLFLGSIFYLLSASTIFVEFIAANLLIYALMFLFAAFCLSLKLIRVYKLSNE